MLGFVVGLLTDGVLVLHPYVQPVPPTLDGIWCFSSYTTMLTPPNKLTSLHAA